MTSLQIQLIQKSWKLFQQIKPEIVGDVFYSKLFTDAPALRKMFPKNMEQQYRKLMDMLNSIISRLERIDEIEEEIAAMAIRHEGYSVRPAHYKLVGKALLWTLEQGLGNDYTSEVKNAWDECYKILADMMIKAAETKPILK